MPPSGDDKIKTARFFDGAELADLYARYRPTLPDAMVHLITDYIGEQMEGRLH